MSTRAPRQSAEQLPADVRAWIIWVTRLMAAAALSSCVISKAAAPASRPPLDATTPLATCDLQSVSDRLLTSRVPVPPGLLLARPVDDMLANYEQSKNNDLQDVSDIDGDDPWVRLLVTGRRGPLLVDIAIFIGGQPFRATREAWIDELMRQAAGEVAPSSEAVARKGESGGDAIEVAARGIPSINERLKNYLAVAGSEVDRREIRWLVAEWGSGPALLVLERSFSWQRAREAPLWVCLDEDDDGTLSAAEIQGADARLNVADKDQDDVVSLDELRRLANRPADPQYPLGNSLMTVLDNDTNWDEVRSNLSSLYGKDAAESMPQSWLIERPADASLRVDLTSDENAESGVSLLSAKDEVIRAAEGVKVAANAIAIHIGGEDVELSAAQPPSSPSSTPAVTQIAVGAVVDGYPLTRVLDRDRDGRLTLRERRQLAALLASLDDNHDRQLTPDEFPTPIRLAVTLGPNVHLLLSTPSASARGIEMRQEPVPQKPPEWFVSMDRNSDGDLSPDEFLGAVEQFSQLDEDGDNLISIAEALQQKK